MLLLKDLQNIQYQDLINNTKSSVNIRNIPTHLNQTDINKSINILFNNNINYIIIKLMNIIEWTPDKMCLEAYFLLRKDDEFWIVKYSTYEIIPYYYSCIKTILENKINNWINKSEYFTRLSYNLFPSNIYMINSIQQLINANNGEYILINKTNIHHYMYKYSNCIIYIPLSNINYAPMIYCPAR